MRIGILTPRFSPECCGVGDYALRLAETWKSLGQETVVFTQPAGGARPEGIAVVETPLRGWRDLRGTLRAVQQVQPDRVQLEYSSYGWGRWGIAFWVNALVAGLRLRGIPVSIGLHEVAIRIRQHPLQIGIALVQRLHFFLLLLTASEVFLNTPERVRVFRRWVPWRRRAIHYRPNSSTIPVTPLSREQRDELRAAQGANSASLAVATFGNFA